MATLVLYRSRTSWVPNHCRLSHADCSVCLHLLIRQQLFANLYFSVWEVTAVRFNLTAIIWRQVTFHQVTSWLKVVGQVIEQPLFFLVARRLPSYCYSSLTKPQAFNLNLEVSATTSKATQVILGLTGIVMQLNKAGATIEAGYK